MRVAIRKCKSNNYYKLELYDYWHILPGITFRFKNCEMEIIDKLFNEVSKLAVLKNNVKILVEKVNHLISTLKYCSMETKNKDIRQNIQFNLSLLYLMLNNKKALTHLFNIHNEFYESYIILGVYGIINGQFKKALDAFTLVSSKYNDPIATALLGTVLYNVDEVEGNKYIWKVMDYDRYENNKIIRELRVSIMFIVRYFHNCKMFDHTLKYLNIAIAKYDNSDTSKLSATFYRELGYYYQRQEDIPCAIKYFDIAVNKGSVNAMNTLAILKYKSKLFDEALGILKSSLTKNYCPFILSNMARLCFLTKNYDEGVKYYVEAIIEDSSYSYISMYKLALYLEKNEDHINMLKYLKISASRGYIYSIYKLAEYYFKNKMYDDMITYLEMGIEQDHIPSYNSIIHYYFIFAHDNYKMLEYYKDAYSKGIHSRIDTKWLNTYFGQNIDLQNMIQLEIFLDETNAKFVVRYMDLEYKNPICLEEECYICLISNRVLVTKCSHHLCKYCYAKLSVCPFCRTDLQIK